MATRKPRRPAARKAATKTAHKTARKPARKAPARETDRHSPQTLRLRAFMPSITVNDLDKSVAFYTGVLRFTLGEQWKDEAGVVRGVMLKAGACELGLSQDDWAKGRDRTKGEAIRVYAETVQDVDDLARRIKAAGGRVTDGPKEESWGARAVSFDDPDGFHFTLYRTL